MGPQEKIAKGDISLKVMVPGIHNNMKVEAVSTFSSLLILLLLLRLLPCVHSNKSLSVVCLLVIKNVNWVLKTWLLFSLAAFSVLRQCVCLN